MSVSNHKSNLFAKEHYLTELELREILSLSSVLNYQCDLTVNTTLKDCKITYRNKDSSSKSMLGDLPTLVITYLESVKCDF